jgi:dihydrofolate reductase
MGATGLAVHVRHRRHRQRPGAGPGVAGDKDVGIGGGANVIQQYLAAGLVDELRLPVAPVLLGAGKPLFGHLGDKTIELERTRVVESPYATRLFFTVHR